MKYINLISELSGDEVMSLIDGLYSDINTHPNFECTGACIGRMILSDGRVVEIQVLLNTNVDEFLTDDSDYI